MSFNKLNTHRWYRDRVRKLDGGHDAEDRMEAFRLSLMWGESIPIGVIFRNRRPAYEERNPVISRAPLVEQAFDRSKLAAASREFY